MKIIALSSTQLPLHDIVDDYSVHWWPLAPGWWLLLVLVIVLVAAGSWWLVRTYQQRRGFRRINQSLSAPVERISDVTLRLKQVLLLKHSRSDLSKSFVTLLVQHLPETQREASANSLREHLELQFQDHSLIDADAFQAWALDWWQHAQREFKQEARHV